MTYCGVCGNAVTELKSSNSCATYVCTVCGMVVYEKMGKLYMGENLKGSVGAKRYIDTMSEY